MDNDAKQERDWIDEFISVYVAPNDATHVAEFLRAKCQPQTDALKRARSVIKGLLDIISDYNLDSEQAGRAFAALHEIGTALAAPEQSK